MSLFPIVAPGTDVWQSVNDITGATVTLNPSDKNARMSLSNGDLTVTHDGTTNHAAVRATHGLDSGKSYYEMTISSTTGGPVNMGGWLDAGNNMADGSYLPVGCTVAIGWGYSSASHNIYGGGFSGPRSGYTQATLPNGTYGFAYDARGGHIWLRDNDGTWLIGDPSTGALPLFSLDGTPTGAVFPGCSHYYSNNVWTFNFGASAFSHGLPN